MHYQSWNYVNFSAQDCLYSSHSLIFLPEETPRYIFERLHRDALFVLLSFDHCIVCPSINGFWVPICHLQTFLNKLFPIRAATNILYRTRDVSLPLSFTNLTNGEDTYPPIIRFHSCFLEARVVIRSIFGFCVVFVNVDLEPEG
jgi:hypothetical protein